MHAPLQPYYNLTHRNRMDSTPDCAVTRRFEDCVINRTRRWTIVTKRTLNAIERTCIRSIACRVIYWLPVALWTAFRFRCVVIATVAVWCVQPVLSRFTTFFSAVITVIHFVILYFCIIIVCMFICSWAERLNALPNKLET